MITLFQGKLRASMKLHKEETKNREKKRVGMKLIEHDKVAKMFLFTSTYFKVSWTP